MNEEDVIRRKILSIDYTIKVLEEERDNLRSELLDYEGL